MPHFLIEASYSNAAVKAFVAKPQDRKAAIEKLCKSMGGKLVQIYFAFGDADAIVIAELPDNEAAAAVALATGASGALSKYRTTVLMTTEEAVSAMKKAKKATYTPPK